MDGAIAAGAGIITGGAEVMATTMVGGIIAITGDLTFISSERPLSWRPFSCPFAQATSPVGSFRTCRGGLTMSAVGAVAEVELKTAKAFGFDLPASLV
jgi:hypothetical protein